MKLVYITSHQILHHHHHIKYCKMLRYFMNLRCDSKFKNYRNLETFCKTLMYLPTFSSLSFFFNLPSLSLSLSTNNTHVQLYLSTWSSEFNYISCIGVFSVAPLSCICWWKDYVHRFMVDWPHNWRWMMFNNRSIFHAVGCTDWCC